jgi:hypothetical protein
MDCRALVSIDPLARRLNTAFHDVVHHLAKSIFFKGGLQAAKSVRDLIHLFDKDHRDGQKQDAICGYRELAIMEPFDANRAFARVASMFAEKSDAHINPVKTILEIPERDQLRYRSAYGLYHAMLDRVSSPEVFPLTYVPDYDHSKVDLLYEEMEFAFLELKKGRTESFFIVPVYYGSLPLFALVLAFPHRFPRASTDAQVFEATLRNLHRQIKLLFTPDFLRTQLLSPFIARAFDAVHEYFTIKGDDRKTEFCQRYGAAGKTPDGEEGVFERYLNVIRFHLDGQTPWSAPFAPDNLGGALGKPWKSWLVTIPSTPIKELEATKAENKQLLRLFDDEAKRALLNHALRISFWFQEGSFFGADCHDEWNQPFHLDLLEKMYNIAGLRPGDSLSTSPMGSAGRKVKHGYFAASTGHYLLVWTDFQIKRLSDIKITPVNKQRIFRQLKVVFCKTFENTGSEVRFGLQRLHALLEAAVGADSPKLQPKVCTPANSWIEREAEAKFIIGNDPTHALADFTHSLLQAKFLKKITMRHTKYEEGGGKIHLKWNFTRAFAHNRGGCDAGEVISFWKHVRGLETFEKAKAELDRKCMIGLTLSVCSCPHNGLLLTQHLNGKQT